MKKKVVRKKEIVVPAIVTETVSPRKKLLIPIIIFAAVLITIVAFFFLYQLIRGQFLPKQPSPVKDEMAQLVGAVGNLVILPKGELQVATVSDKKKLADQPFFSRAENGDKVLIYTEPTQNSLFLYRPSLKKLVGMATIPIQQPSAVPSTNTIPTPEPTQAQLYSGSIMIYNGTKTAGLATTAKQNLSKLLPELTFETGDAKKNYSKTLIVDISGNNKPLATELAGKTGGEVGQLPEGEIKPDTDILIILGN